LDEAQRDGAGDEIVAGGERGGGAVESQHRECTPLRGGAEGADRLLRGGHDGAGIGGKSVVGDRHDAGAGNAAMFHARHHLLADIAALGEIDAVKLVHVGLVEKRVAIAEIPAAAGHAQRVGGPRTPPPVPHAPRSRRLRREGGASPARPGRQAHRMHGRISSPRRPTAPSR
jgi:hypothetical protein